MKNTTANALSQVWNAASKAEDFAASTITEVNACENEDKFTPMRAGFLRNRLEGVIENAKIALASIPEGED